MPLIVSDHIAIPDEELEWKFIRSSGPGGQNVNKVASAVQLRFLLPRNTSLPAAVQEAPAPVRGTEARRRRQHPAHRAGASAARNKIGAPRSSDWATSMRAALIEPKIRKKTRPTRASKERRIDVEEAPRRHQASAQRPRLGLAGGACPGQEQGNGAPRPPLQPERHLQDVVPQLLGKHELGIDGDSEQRLAETDACRPPPPRSRCAGARAR